MGATGASVTGVEDVDQDPTTPPLTGATWKTYVDSTVRPVTVADVNVEPVFDVNVVHVEPLLLEYLTAYPDGAAGTAGI